MGKDEKINMDNTFQEDLVTVFNTDESVDYKDAMEEELVDHLEAISGMEWNGEKVTDEILRKLLTKVKQASFIQDNAMDTLEKKVMGKAHESSMKNDEMED